MPRKPPSKADVDLADALTALGIDGVSPRNVERLREYGLLETRPTPGLGYGRGSESKTAPAELERAAFAFRVKQRQRRWTQVTLMMFVDGRYPVPRDKLNKAYFAELGAIATWLDSYRDSNPLFGAAHGAAAAIVGRALKHPATRFIRQQFTSTADHRLHVATQSALTDLLSILERGTVASPDGPAQTLRLFGADALDLDLDSEDATPRVAPVDVGWQQSMSLLAMVRHVSTASTTDLEEARDALKFVRQYARTLGPVLDRLYGPAKAFPWLVIGRSNDRQLAYAALGAVSLITRDDSSPAAHWFRFATASIDALTTMKYILDRIPDDLTPAIRSARKGEASAQEIAALGKAFQAIEQESPGVLESAIKLAEAAPTWDN